VQLTFDADVEAFRADFVAFLDEFLLSEADALERSRSSSHIPEWARRWQRLMFDNGWLLPGYPPEFGGRSATLLQQYVHQQELARRRAYLTFNPQGVGIIAASLISFGTPEQQRRWAVPILRAEMTASLGMSEPGAGSDLASLRTRAVRDGDDFVVNGQKVWTSGAHDADEALAHPNSSGPTPRCTSTCTGPAGSSASSVRSAARSPAALQKSNATSLPSECWACPEIEDSPCTSNMTSPTASRPSP
jgi:alkylation response protein AidB-like acyl-CoA dehydrogenase